MEQQPQQPQAGVYQQPTAQVPPPQTPPQQPAKPNRLAGLVGKKTAKVQVMLFVGYFGLLLLVRLFTFGPGSLLSLGTVTFLLGGVLGMYVSIVDRLVYVYYSHPEEQLSIQIKSLISQRRWRAVLHVLYDQRSQMQRLSMNNVLFLGVWVGLAFFLVSSSLSAFAQGLVMGIGLQLVYGLAVDWKNREYLKQRLFWPVRRQMSDVELKAVVGVFVGAFMLMSWFAV